MRRRLLISTVALMSTIPFARAQPAAGEKNAPGATPRNQRIVEKLPQKLVFGLITPRSPELTLKNWNPFIDRMEKAAGIPIERQTFTTQGELVKEFLQGRIDLAWLGNAPALDVVEANKGSVFAAMVVQGKTAYRSVLIAHKDSNIRTLDDVHRMAPQLVFGDGDVKSTSGHIVPKYFAFVKKGINDPEKMFKEVKRGSHESNQQAVLRRDVDIATGNTSELDNFRTAKPDQAGLLKVIWESPDIPESPMIWRNNLPESLKAKIGAFTFKFGAVDDEEKGILWNINKLSAFRKSTNRQLTTIADVEMFNARQQVVNDSKLTEQERQIKVDEITKRGSKLELMLKRAL